MEKEELRKSCLEIGFKLLRSSEETLKSIEKMDREKILIPQSLVDLIDTLPPWYRNDITKKAEEELAISQEIIKQYQIRATALRLIQTQMPTESEMKEIQDVIGKLKEYLSLLNDQN